MAKKVKRRAWTKSDVRELKTHARAEDPGTQDCTRDEENARGDQTKGISIGRVAGFALIGANPCMGAPVLRVAEAQQARIMLNFLLAHKIAIGRILSVVGATATVVIFEYFFELSVYIAVPVAILAYVTMPMCGPS